MGRALAGGTGLTFDLAAERVGLGASLKYSAFLNARHYQFASSRDAARTPSAGPFVYRSVYR
jgi:hypothetical protein